MKKIQKHIFQISLCASVLYLTLGDGYGALHSLSELPSTFMSIGANEVTEKELLDLVHEKEGYNDRFESDVKFYPILDDDRALGSSYIVERTSRLNGAVGDAYMTSELLEKTLIRNKENTSLDPEEIGIEPASDENIRKAKKKFLHDEMDGSPDKLQVFEFGIAGEHLIFSQPVKLSIDVPGFEEGSQVKISVLHADDTEFGVSGLTDSTGECRADGSSTKTISTSRVHGGNVTFYTCGASTFAVGVPQAIHLPNGTVWSMLEQADENIIIAGSFTGVGGYPRGRLARILSGGTIDTSFADPNINNIVYATSLQSDGKIIVGGAFTGVTGITRNFLARINTDGTLDTSFTPNLNNQVRTLAVLADDSILIGGLFTTSSGTTRNRMMKFSSTGGLIGSFTPNFNNSVFAITPEPSGTILVGGQFTTMSGTARNRIVRLSATGGLIGSFTPNFNNIVQDIKLYSDNNIIVGGQFTTMSGTAKTRLVKLSSTGGLISSYSIGANGTVNTINVQTDDSTIVGGAFTTLSGVTRNRIAQISSTGVLDVDFNPNANGAVYSIKNDSFNNALVGGAFTTMSGISAPYFVWIGLYDGDITPPQILSGTMISGSLLPRGAFTIRTNFTDTGGGIDTPSVHVMLERWDGADWGADVESTYLSGSPTITMGTGIYTFSGVPYGKYRYTLFVSDIWGNESTYESTFYIDGIEWEIDSDVVDIGDILPGIQRNSSGSTNSGELVITVRTVGAGFNIIMSGTSFASGTSPVIAHWAGGAGYGYERYNYGYTGTLSSLSGGVTLITQGVNINTDGDLNEHIYYVQYGALVNFSQPSSDYRGTTKFTLNLTY